MLWPHGREVSPVECEHHLGLESLGKGDDRRIGSAEGKVGVAFDQLSDSNSLAYRPSLRQRALELSGERTYGKKAQVPSGQWSTLRVVAAGPLFEVHFNWGKLFEVEDKTFAQAGKVGVWTKADSVIRFDDLTVVTR